MVGAEKIISLYQQILFFPKNPMLKYMTLWPKLLLTSLLFMLLHSVVAIGQTMPIRKYDVKNGLSENSVMSIVQDSTGYMWMGTKDGLNCFNGIEFKIFGNSSKKIRNRQLNITNLYLHKDNKSIWIATTDSLYLFDTITESITPFDKKTDAGNGVKNVLSICYDSHNTMWIGTMDGLFAYDINKKLLKRYARDHSNPASIPDSQVLALFEDSSGILWIGTRRGVARYKRDSDSFVVYPAPSRIKNSNDPFEITFILESTQGDIWIGTRYDGLALLDKISGSFKFYPTQNIHVGNSRIRTLFQYSDSTLLIGTQDGLFSFDMNTNEMSKPKILLLESIYAMNSDREGGVWIGTYFGGVYYISPKSKDIEWYYDKNSDNSLSGNAVSQFCEDTKGNIWIATENGGLNYFDTATKGFKHYKSGNTGNNISYNNIHALLLDDDNLWIGTFSKGIDVMNTKSGVVKNYRNKFSDTKSIPHDHIYSIYKTRKGDIFIGTLGGFCKYIPGKYAFHRYEELRTVFVYDIIEDSQGNIWIASKGDGIYRYDPEKGSFRNYRHTISDGDKSPGSNRIIRAYIDSSQRLWFCTENNGICMYNYQSDSFTVYNSEKGLPSNVIYGMLDDVEGNLWLSSNRGIIRYNPSNRQYKLYTHEEGLQSDQFNFRSSLKASDGKFYFGGIEGFNCFYPDRMKLNTVPPTCKISGVYFYENETRSIVDVSAKEIKVPYKISLFEISFESLSYIAPSKNKYAYKIDNVHDNWIYTNKHSVTFLNLPAGKYTFRVKSANNDGIWSQNDCFIDINVQSPPWSGTMAKIIYTAIFLLLAIVFIRQYKHKQRRKVDREKKEMELSLEKEMYNSKIQFFTHVAHEVKTPVSLIKAPLDAILEADEWSDDTKENLHVIERNTNRLLELIKQLLDFRKVDKDTYQLQYSKIDINCFMDDILKRFVPSTPQEVVIEKQFPQEHLIYNVDTEALTKIVSNLLSNALKYAKSVISISLNEHIQSEKRMMEIVITNDGIGISPEETNRLFEPFFQASSTSAESGFGIGLSLVKLLVEKHQGYVCINDKYIDGFQIIVTLPYIETMQSDANRLPADNLTTQPDEQIYSLNEWTVLVVEDSKDMREFLMKNLAQDYNILGATDGNEALKILRSKSVDIIVSDIVMPQMDGYGLLQAVRSDKLLCHIPFILLSAQDSENSKIMGLEYGADAYIEKPFSLNHIKASLHNLLENRRLLFDRFSKSPHLGLEKNNINKYDLEWLEQINSIITENFSNEEFSVETLSSEMSLSRSSFQRKLKGITGLAPIDYIRLIRLKTAANILKEGKYRINEVSYMVGFTNNSYFARCFQKQFGVLPKDFIKKGDSKSSRL